MAIHGLGRVPIAPVPRACRLALVAAALAQGPALALSIPGGGALLPALLGVSAVLALGLHRLLAQPVSYAWGLTLAMLAIGNLGMLAGVALDAALAPAGFAGSCLAGYVGGDGQGLGLALGGMLLACLPPLLWIRPRQAVLARLPQGRPLWMGHALLCPLAMWVGMLAGAVLWANAPVSDLAARLLGGFVATSTGMALAMLATCHGLDGLAARWLGLGVGERGA